MRGTAAMLALSFCLPLAAAANSLTYEFWPTGDPDDSVSCAVRLGSGLITAVEVQGLGMPQHHPMRWPVRQSEVAVLMAALQALVARDLPSVDTYTVRLPPPPFVTVTWMARVDGGMMSGLYVQSGTGLPRELVAVLTGLMPGGPCASAAVSP